MDNHSNQNKLQHTFFPEGVCSRQIDFAIENNLVKTITFHSGCPGNLQGISLLAEGMPVAEVIKRLKGVRCGGKPTSCPDQLAQALEKAEQNLK